jgi:hypothetical protein
MKAMALYLVGLVFFGFTARVEGSDVLTGRELLRTVRQIQGRRNRPAYVDRTVKVVKVAGDANTTATTQTDQKLLEPTAAEHTKIPSALMAIGKADRKDIEKPPEADIRSRLAQVVDLSSLTKDVPFSEALEILRNSVEPPLELVVFWTDLWENAYIGPDTPINMQFLGAMQLRKALELLLKYSSIRLSEVGFVVEDGFIAIATKEFLRRKLLLNVTGIADLLGAPADFSFEMDVGDIRQGTTGGSGGRRSTGRAGSARSSSSRY